MKLNSGKGFFVFKDNNFYDSIILTKMITLTFKARRGKVVEMELNTFEVLVVGGLGVVFPRD